MTDPDLPMFAPLDSERGNGETVTRADVVAEARELLDVPYVHQGRSVHGLDCVGLIIVVARQLGLVPAGFDETGYGRVPDGKSMLEICDRFMVRVHPSNALPGHVLVYEFNPKSGPQHMGILGDYLHGGFSLIQALGTTDGKGRVLEWNLDRPRKGWKPVQAYALPGVK